MRIFIATDLHYDERSPYESDSKENLTKIINKANELDSDLLIFAGDMFHQALQDGAKPEPWPVRSEESVRNVLNILKQKLDQFAGKYGYVYLAGNHEALAWVVEDYFGYRYNFIVKENVLILGLCTSDFNSYWLNYVSAKQLEDLKNTIDANKDIPAIAVCHVPIYQTWGTEFITAPAWTHIGYWAVRNRQAVADILKTHPRLACVIAGHIWPDTAGYLVGLDLTHIQKRHTTISDTAPYFILRDQYIVDVYPATGLIDVDVWRFDYNDKVDVYSVTV